MACGCEQRQERLNDWRPGLGDRVAVFAEPVKALALALVRWLAQWLR